MQPFFGARESVGLVLDFLDWWKTFLFSVLDSVFNVNLHQPSYDIFSCFMPYGGFS